MAGENHTLGEDGRKKGAVTDLYNFDAPEHQNSRYILTSPRSLRACARLGIKPVELLPKSLAEFSTSSGGLGLGEGEGTMREVFLEWERQRRASLQAARIEREKIIAASTEPGRTSSTKAGKCRRERARAVADIPPLRRPNLQAWTGKSWEGGKDLTVSFEEPLPTHSRSQEGEGVESMTGGFIDGLVNGHARTAALKSTYTLPLKDQRILGALTQRLSEEEQLASLRKREAWQWEQERRGEERDRREWEKRHQQKLAHSQKLFQRQLSQLQSARQSTEEALAAERLAQLREKEERWERSAQLQAITRDQQAAGRKLRGEGQRRQQKERLRELEEEKMEQTQLLDNHLRMLEDRAASNREELAHREAMKRQDRLVTEKLRHERKKSEVEAINREEHEALRLSVLGKHAQAQKCLQAVQAQMEAQLSETTNSRSQRTLQRKMTAEKMEAELGEWRREVDHCNKTRVARAEETARRLLDERSQTVQMKRTEKEREHAQNYRRVMEEEEVRRQQLAAEVRLKRAKSETIFRERESALHQSREVAQASARLRRQVKDHYLRNSFDRMVQEAELYASLDRRSGHCTRTGTKNVSKVILA